MSIKKATIAIIISLIIGGSIGKVIGYRQGLNLCAVAVRDQLHVEINLEKVK